MKRLLITGRNSYIGSSLKKWLKHYSNDYIIETISLRGESWKNNDFSNYDIVLHLAGIAHVSSDPKQKELYYKVNRDLTIEAAEKAKQDGVKQFIFMSSIIVYGGSALNNDVITSSTIPYPKDFYGDSKLQAEKGIASLESENFKIAIVRPPMVYGKGSKGNYLKLSKLAKVAPIFPDIENKRSMIHIDNLCEFIRLLIDNEEKGLFFPQNEEYVKTSEMVRLIAEEHTKKIHLTKAFNPIVRIMRKKSNIVNKIFGNLIYEQELSKYKEEYCIHDLKFSIKATEKLSKKNTIRQRNVDVLLMSDNGLETVGGEQESIKIILQGTRKDFSLGVIQPGEIKNPIDSVEYYPLTSQTRIKHFIKSPILFLNYILKVKRIIVNEKPKIIHTHAQVSFFIVALLNKFKFIPKSTYIIHTERGLYTRYNKFFIKLFHIFLKELNVLITTTSFNMKYWQAASKNLNTKLEFQLIENTAGELFEVYDQSCEKVPSNNVVLGFAGRYSEQKNWPLAIDIVKKMNEILGEDLHVKMAVGCLDDTAEEQTKTMFEDLYELLGSRFSGMINIDIDTMDKFYYSIDIFVMTSERNSESFGRTLVEAMSRKTIVLSTDAGGPVEVINRKYNIFESVEECAEKIIYFHNNNEAKENEKVRSLNRVKNVYSLDNNIIKHLNIYSNNME